MRFAATCLGYTLALALLPTAAHAQVDPAELESCARIATANARLACYDAAVGRETAPVPRPRATTRNVLPHDDPEQPADLDECAGTDADAPLLNARWELAVEARPCAFRARAYRPIYLMPAFYTSRTNRLPRSPSPDNSATTSEDIDRTEMKYQLSLKTKVWPDIFGDNGDLWMGYTQSSHWQVFNSDTSRPFRETNYEPDANLMLRTNYRVFGWTGRLLGIGLVHQSNGRSDPLSRSWNRVVANVGFERDGWTLLLRPWWRIPESRSSDDNPDIVDYMGRGEIQLIHAAADGFWKDHQFSWLLRNSFRGGDRNHGAIQFDWAFPIAVPLRGHVQIFHGYGESLIDYNHRAWYAGIGVSLVEWY